MDPRSARVCPQRGIAVAERGPVGGVGCDVGAAFEINHAVAVSWRRGCGAGFVGDRGVCAMHVEVGLALRVV